MASKIVSTGYIKTSDGNLFYEREGASTGKTILFIHGLGGTTNAYQPLLSDLQDFDLVRFDWSGHGRSAVRPAATIETYVKDCEAILDRLELSDVIVVGHSLGGLIALHLAAKQPDKVQSLVLFGPVSPPPEAGQVGLKKRASSVREAGMVSVADTVVGNAFAAASYTRRKAEVALAREMLTRQDPEGYALACEALAESSPARWDLIRARVLVISGKEDKVSTVAAGQSIASNLGSHTQQLVWDEVGHWHMLEAPELSIEAIRNAAR